MKIIAKLIACFVLLGSLSCRPEVSSISLENDLQSPDVNPVIPRKNTTGSYNYGTDFASDTDPEFNPYLERFIQFAQDRGREIDVTTTSVVFSDDLESAALCSGWDTVGGINVVYVQREWWQKYTDTHRREFLIFHELGHCVLNRDHRDDRDGNRPLSLMTPNVNTAYANYYRDHYDSYIDELFSGN